MNLAELKDKAASLPLAPGVYIMRDSDDRVIYVGKAKKLKNRVTQYFQDTASHSPKTRLMVSKISRFDVIVAASEFEALVLECSLIKRYLPKYNILLKDDKGYPYLRLDTKEHYPRITMVNKFADDGAGYYGPYGSRSVTQELMDAIRLCLRLPDCNKQFPRDIGKGRPCLNYHMNQCAGWCIKDKYQEYRNTIEQAKRLLEGNYKQVADGIKKDMLRAAEDLNFELAANLRDRLNAVESLGKKQLVTAGTLADTDVIGFAGTGTKDCFTVLHFSGGNLLDKDYEIISTVDDPQSAVSSLLKQYYLGRGFVPKRVLLPFPVDDIPLFAQLIHEQFGQPCKFIVPQRGDNLRLVKLAIKNAKEEAQRVTSQEEHILSSITLLGKMLSIDLPRRIESFDISNISGTDIVASMVVYIDGKPSKRDFRRFKINDLENQDDYASVAQVVERRFKHYLSTDVGFDVLPDLLLIDGGAVHAMTARRVLESMSLSVPVFGMVKDDRHRTRALVSPQGDVVSIDSQQAVFSLIGNIQEQTHNFAINYHRKLRSKRLRYSQLDQIAGIGPKRKQELLRIYRSIDAISKASLPELEKHLPKNAAFSVYQHFHRMEDKEELCE